MPCQIKRVRQGEEAGDLVLEEDLTTGGCGLTDAVEGAGLAEALEARNPKEVASVSPRKGCGQSGTLRQLRCARG